MKHSLPATFAILALFVLAQVIGLFVVNSYLTIDEKGEVSWKTLPSIAGVSLERPQVSPDESVWVIAGAIILGTIIFFIILRFKRTSLLRVWFFLAALICLFISFGAFIPAGIAAIFALIGAFFKVFRFNWIIHTVSEVFLYGGLAAIFVPILNVKFAFLLMILLSLYDMYAVWQSKHMIKLAKFQAEAKMFAGLILPYKSDELKPAKEGQVKMWKKEGVKTAMLGGGDIGFPLLFNGVLITSFGLWKALALVPFTTVALALLFFLAKKDKFYPALPFISAGCFIGYAVLIIL